MGHMNHRMTILQLVIIVMLSVKTQTCVSNAAIHDVSAHLPVGFEWHCASTIGDDVADIIMPFLDQSVAQVDESPMNGIHRSIAVLEHCVQVCPSTPLCWYNLGVLYHKTGVFAQGRADCAMAKAAQLWPLRFAPGLAMLFNNQGKYQDALCTLSPITHSDPWFAVWLETVGDSLACATNESVNSDESDKSLGYFMSAQERWTARVQALLEWATAVCLGANKADAVRACEMAYESLESVLEREESTDLLAKRIHVAGAFLLGRLAEEAHLYDSAWAKYEKANQLKLSIELVNTQSQSRDHIFYAYLDALQHAFTRHNVDVLHATLHEHMRTLAETPHPRIGRRLVPIFVAGLPRTGSSLAEQVLSAHNDVFAAGEVAFFDDHGSLSAECAAGYMNCQFTNIENDLSPENAKLKVQGYLNAIVDWYLDNSDTNRQSAKLSLEHCNNNNKKKNKNKNNGQADGNGNDYVHGGNGYTNSNGSGTYYSCDPLYFTDKLPMNWRYFPLIRLLMPQARIVQTTRNYVDTALSNYFADYMPPAFYWAHDLGLLKKQFQVYHQTMFQWRKALAGLKPLFSDQDIRPWFELKYEKAVQKPAEQFEKLFRWVGLGSSWNVTAMLDTVNHKRHVFTASSQQVKQPLYTTSVEKWRRYERHVRQSEELVDLLFDDYLDLLSGTKEEEGCEIGI